MTKICKFTKIGHFKRKYDLNFHMNPVSVYYIITRATRNCSNFIANYARKKFVFVSFYANFILTFDSDISLLVEENNILFHFLIYFLINIHLFSHLCIKNISKSFQSFYMHLFIKNIYV